MESGHEVRVQFTVGGSEGRSGYRWARRRGAVRNVRLYEWELSLIVRGSEFNGEREMSS